VRPRRSLPGADGHRSGKPSPTRVPRGVLMDARLRRQGHSLTPHDVSPQPPLSSAQLLTARNGVAGRRRERRNGEKGKSVAHRSLSWPPSPPLPPLPAPPPPPHRVPRDDEVCMLYQGRRASPCVPDVLRTVLRVVDTKLDGSEARFPRRPRRNFAARFYAAM